MLLIINDIWMCSWGTTETSSPCRGKGSDCHADPWTWAVCCSVGHSCKHCWPLMQKSMVDDLLVYSLAQAMVLTSTGHFSGLIWFPLSSWHLWTWAQPPISLSLSSAGRSSPCCLEAWEQFFRLQSSYHPGTESGLGKVTCFTSFLVYFAFFFDLDKFVKLLCVRVVKRQFSPHPPAAPRIQKQIEVLLPCNK